MQLSGWNRHACNIVISRESMILVLRPDCQLNANGCVFSVPIVEDDVIDIQIELAQTQTRTPRGQRAVGRHHRNDWQQQSVVGDHQVSPTRVSFPDDGSSGLASQSYDKIRQNFKCPKFTGKPKD
jgi:hypothetical protein